jgi:glutamyl-Q tRNA(Asp) synthetase
VSVSSISNPPLAGTYRGRFAPSPTGALHFGSLVAALASWLRARSRGGVWIVRMEDVDTTRAVPGSADDILNTLAAFGMVSDEPVLLQSDRAEHYAAALSRLIEAGAAFACRCSRAELPEDGLHRACVGKLERTPAWRVRAPDRSIVFRDEIQDRQQQNLARDVGDFVVKRADGLFAYQLAVVVDDAAQGITEVVRGADLLDSTARQIYVQGLLGLPQPTYAHVPLAVDASGAKLSKQHHAAPVDANDPLPALRLALGFLGFATEKLPRAGRVDAQLSVALAAFDWHAIPARTHIAV